MEPMIKFELTLDEYSHVYASLHYAGNKLKEEDPFDDRVPVMRKLAENMKASAGYQLGFGNGE